MLHAHTALLTRRRFLENSALGAACALVPQKTKAKFRENPAMRKGMTRPSGRTKRGPILRYNVPPEAREEHLAELITTCQHTGITDVAGDFANYSWSSIDPAGQLRPLVTTSRNGRIEAMLDQTLPSLGCTFLPGRRTT